MIQRLMGAAIVGLTLIACTSAKADIFNFMLSLDSAQAGIAGSTGTGTGTVQYDDATGDIAWDISFQGLTGTTTNAHFHGPAMPGVPAGVRLGTPFPAGVTSGVIAGSSNISAAFGTELIGGLWYHNIHTTHAGGGEIRGQVLLIPEPTTAAMTVGGLIVAGTIARFRRRRN
jgi:hypothetical protein